MVVGGGGGGGGGGGSDVKMGCTKNWKKFSPCIVGPGVCIVRSFCSIIIYRVRYFTYLL